MLCMLALGVSLASCSDDDDDSLDDGGSKVTLPQTRVYILNEGSQGANNAGLAFYAPNIWGIERSGFFNGREKWAKGFENQRV
ncbi:hypothetical protein I080019B2_18010 [Bacteroides stercoris]